MLEVRGDHYTKIVCEKRTICDARISGFVKLGRMRETPSNIREGVGRYLNTPVDDFSDVSHALSSPCASWSRGINS